MKNQIDSLAYEMEADQREMKADKRKMMAKIDKMDANQHEMKATIRSGHEEMIKAITGASPESTEACEEKTKALPETTEACPEVTPACLEEKKEPAPEEPKAVAETEEVPEGATDEEKFGATEDRAGELRLVLRRHRQRKKRAQENGGPRQKFASLRGRFTRRPVPALRKGQVRKGPGRTLGGRMTDRGLKQREAKNDAVQGTPKGRTCERRSRTQPRRDCGMKDREMKQRPRLGRGRAFIEALGQTLGLKVVEWTFESSTRLRRPSIWKLWKSRPPPKRKR
jgi:hypothetical protein